MDITKEYLEEGLAIARKERDAHVAAANAAIAKAQVFTDLLQKLAAVPAQDIPEKESESEAE